MLAYDADLSITFSRFVFLAFDVLRRDSITPLHTANSSLIANNLVVLLSNGNYYDRLLQDHIESTQKTLPVDTPTPFFVSAELFRWEQHTIFAAVTLLQLLAGYMDVRWLDTAAPFPWLSEWFNNTREPIFTARLTPCTAAVLQRSETSCIVLAIEKADNGCRTAQDER